MTATQSPPQQPGAPVPAPPRRPRRPRGPVPGLWGRTLLAGVALFVAFLALRGPVGDLFGGLIERMADGEKAEEVDVDVLVLELTPDDAPLEFGSRDDSETGPVRALQLMLAELGFDSGIPDGVYGAGTEEAVRTFQQSQIGLDATGRADEVTINVIRRVFSGRELDEDSEELPEGLDDFDPGGNIDDPLNPDLEDSGLDADDGTGSPGEGTGPEGTGTAGDGGDVTATTDVQPGGQGADGVGGDPDDGSGELPVGDDGAPE